MKHLIPITAILMLCGCERQIPIVPVGRFEIRSGTYDQDTVIYTPVATNFSTDQHHAVFKIDTISGETWIYLSSVYAISNKMSYIQGWSEIRGVTNRTIFKNQ